MKNKGIFILIFFVMVSGLPLMSADPLDEAMELTESNAEQTVSVNWTKHVVQVKGNGFGPESVAELGRRKILAKRAAMIDAQRNLIEAIKGVSITSSTTVEDLMLKSDMITSRTEGMVKGMRMVDVNFSNDGGCEVTVEINLNEQGEFLISALNDAAINVSDDYPKFDWVAMRKELESTKVRLSKAYGEINTAKTRLAAANNRLKETQTQLAAVTLKGEELKKALDSTSSELNDTRQLLSSVKEDLWNNKTQLAVKDKELAMTNDYLSEKKGALDKMATEVEQYRQNWASASIDKAKLEGYVQTLREIQSETRSRLDTIPAGNTQQGGYTGLVVDARKVNVKPALAPAIINENRQQVYGAGMKGSMVSFVTGTLQGALKNTKVGNNPLVVEALQAVKDTDIMISNMDVARMADLAGTLADNLLVLK